MNHDEIHVWRDLGELITSESADTVTLMTNSTTDDFRIRLETKHIPVVEELLAKLQALKTPEPAIPTEF